MPRDVIMPALGMAQNEGVLVAWLKASGDPVKAGEGIMEVETDKATMEVEAEADGFLTDLQAEAGEAIPVGQVVARISDTAEGSGGAPAGSPDPAPAAADQKAEGAEASDAAGALPEGRQVIMPALGMTQDSGLIVAWLKAPGDKVGADDPLLEVETDKATMEVPAGADGYLGATLAAAGEDVPVGDVIAVITADKPDAPVARSRADGAAAPAPSAPPADPPQAKEAGSGAETTPKAPSPAPAAAATTGAWSGGRILASPKARRLAAEQGLDLVRLADAGVPQPYHVADLDTLRDMPAVAAPTEAAVPGTHAAAQRLIAEVPRAGFEELLSWLAAEAGVVPERAPLMAAFAAAGLRSDPASPLAVATENPVTGTVRRFADPDLCPLDGLSAVDGDAPPDLVIRDLTGTAISGLQLGAEAAPVLSVTGAAGDTLAITYEGRLPPQRALALVNGFAARLADPLRHLL